MYNIVCSYIRYCRSTCDICKTYDVRTTYDIIGSTYDVVTYDIQEYRRYDVTYDIVGATYDLVVTDLRYRR